MKKRERNIIISSIIVTLLVALLLFVTLLTLAPDATAYSVNNYGWNGMHDVDSQHPLHEINSISQITSSVNNTVLLEIAPTINFTTLQDQLVKNFVTSGGTLLVMDNSGFSNSLLKGIGSNILVSGDLVLGSTFNWKQAEFPIGIASNVAGNSLLNGVTALAFSNASSLIVSSSRNVSVIATSGPQSLALNLSTNAVASKGPYIMVAVQNIGSGKLMVIGDSTFFLNSLWSKANNGVLINNMLSNSTVYLDTANWPINSQTTVKAYFVSLYSLLSSIPYRYLFALGLVGAAIFSFRTINTTLSLKNEEEIFSSKTRREGTFNKATIDRVRKDRDKYGISA